MLEKESDLFVFYSLLQRSGLVKWILSLPKVTLFVPTNEAYAATVRTLHPGDVKDSAGALLNTFVELDGVRLVAPFGFISILYQTAPGISFTEVKGASPRLVPTLLGSGFHLLSSGLGEIVDIGKVTRNGVVLRTIEHEDGLAIHVLDAVPFPFDLHIPNSSTKCL